MLYKNNSDSIIPLGSKVCQPKGFIDLTEEEVQDPAISPYIGPANLVKTVETPPVKKVPKVEAPKTELVEMPTSKTSKTDVTGDEVGTVVLAPKAQTDEELKTASDKEKEDETVGISVTEKLGDGTSVRVQAEVPKKKLDGFIKKLKGMTSWKKKIEIAETQDDIALLELASAKLKKGKVKEAMLGRITELKKNEKRGK